MNKEQEIAGAKIIDAHKKNNGTLNWTIFFGEEWQNLFNNITDGDEVDIQLTYVRGILEDYGLIESFPYSAHLTRLTGKGANFKSFGKLKFGKYVEDFPKKRWWVLLLVSYFAGIGTEKVKIYMMQKQLTNNQKEPPALPASVHSQQNIHRLSPSDTLKNNN